MIETSAHPEFGQFLKLRLFEIAPSMIHTIAAIGRSGTQ